MKVLKRITAILLIAAAALPAAACGNNGRLPTETVRDILDDKVGAVRYFIGQDLSASETYPQDLERGFYVSTSQENAEQIFGDNVDGILDIIEEQADTEIDRETIDNLIFYRQMAADRSSGMVMLHLEFDTRHSANSIIMSLVEKARSGSSGRSGRSSGGSELSEEELDYNLFDRGYILVYFDTEVTSRIVNDVLDDYLEQKLANRNAIIRTVGAAVIKAYALSKLPDLENIESVVAFYYEYDTITILTGFTTTGSIRPLDILCEETGINTPMHVENSDTVSDFAEPFVRNRLEDLVDYAVDNAITNYLEGSD